MVFGKADGTPVEFEEVAGGVGGFAIDEAERIVGMTHADNDPNPDPDYVHVLDQLNGERFTYGGRIALRTADATRDEVWTGDADGLALAMGSKGLVPGYPPEVTSFELAALRLSEDGTVTFNAQLFGGQFTNNETATLRAVPGSATLLAGPGYPTPELPGTITRISGQPGANGAGIIGFRALYDDDKTMEPGVGIWAGTPEAPSLVAYHGMDAPVSGFSFTSVAAPMITAAGDAMFFGSISDGQVTDSVLWSWDGDLEGNLEMVTMLGAPIVNVQGATFLGFTTLQLGLAINARHQMAAKARLRFADGDITEAIICSDQQGALHAVAVTGEPFKVAEGDVRIVQDVQIIGISGTGQMGWAGDDGRATFLSDLGHLTFGLDFGDDERGIFTARVTESGDLDQDGVIDTADLMDLVGQWGPCPIGPCPADLDGRVSVLDLLLLVLNWG